MWAKIIYFRKVFFPFAEKKGLNQSIDSFKSYAEDSDDDKESTDLANIGDDQTLNIGELSQGTSTPVLPVDATNQPVVQPTKSFPSCIDNESLFLIKEHLEWIRNQSR